MKTKTILIVSIVLILLAFFVGRCEGKKSVSVIETTTTVDTLYHVDTVYITKPEIINRVIVKKERVPVKDTVRIYDTLYVELCRESIESKKDSVYRVVASGINPSIDTVEVYPTTVYIDRVTNNVQYIKKKTKWGLGVQAGYGVTLSKTPVLSPYVGVGIQYNLLSF